MGVLNLVVIIAVIAVIYVFGIGAYFAYRSNKDKKWLSEHENVSKIVIKSSFRYVTYCSIRLYSVDGDTSYQSDSICRSHEKLSEVVYLMPGEHELSVEAVTTRPGIFYKRVSRVYEAPNLKVKVEKGKNYVLTFDLQDKKYVFEENM